MVLALAILGTSLSILAQIASTGVDAAREARALASARLICQNKLSELLLNMEAGQTPTTIVEAEAEPFDSASTESFVYTVEILPAPLDGLLAVRVTVKALAGDGTEQLAVYSLDRWVIDPALGLEELEMEEQAAREAMAGGESTSSDSSGMVP
jgi:type II secretory pathway pseudopilin PulG